MSFLGTGILLSHRETIRTSKDVLIGPLKTFFNEPN